MAKRHKAFIGVVGSGTTTALLNHMIESHDWHPPENMPFCNVFKIYDSVEDFTWHYLDQNYCNVEQMRELSRKCPENDRIVVTFKVANTPKWEGVKTYPVTQWPSDWELVFV